MSILTLEEKIKRFPIACYTRVCGWYTGTKQFNKGKVAEYKDRKEYNVVKPK